MAPVSLPNSKKAPRAKKTAEQRKQAVEDAKAYRSAVTRIVSDTMESIDGVSKQFGKYARNTPKIYQS